MTRRSIATPTSSPIFRSRKCAPRTRKTGQRDLAHLMQGFGDPYSLLPKGTQANIEVLSDALRNTHGTTGFFNVEPDPDGVVRHSLLVLPYGRSKNFDDWDMYGSLDVQAVRLYLGLPDQQTVLDFSETGVTALEFGPSLVDPPRRHRADDDRLRRRRGHLSVRFDCRRRESQISAGNIQGENCAGGRVGDRESAICARRPLAESIIREWKFTPM